MDKEAKITWIAGLKEGDEVCHTNKYDISRLLFGKMLGGGLFGGSLFGTNPEPKENAGELFCKILKVRGRLNDGGIVVGDTVFTTEGKVEHTTKSELSALAMEGELMEVTDELRELASRLEFVNLIKVIDWDKVEYRFLQQIAQTINEAAEVYTAAHPDESKEGKS